MAYESVRGNSGVFAPFFAVVIVAERRRYIYIVNSPTFMLSLAGRYERFGSRARVPYHDVHTNGTRYGILYSPPEGEYSSPPTFPKAPSFGDWPLNLLGWFLMSPYVLSWVSFCYRYLGYFMCV